MNYIKQLQAENETLKADKATIQTAMNDFLALLNSAKFTGVDLDGSRKDWITTGDVVAWLRETRQHTLAN